MSATQKKTQLLQFSKSTKGTHVYSTPAEAAPVSSVYISKAALPTTPPAQIRLTIEWD